MGRVALGPEPGCAALLLPSLQVWAVSNPNTDEQEAAAEVNPAPILDFHPCYKAGGNWCLSVLQPLSTLFALYC